MKTLLTIIATALMVNFAIAQGQSAKAVVKTAELAALKESGYDFGKIQQGRPVTHEFEVFNSATDTLKLEDVKTSCGCTTPVWQRTPVAPNSGTKITVGYNAYSEGPFEKTITLIYNGGQTKVMTIKGNVYKAPATPAPENSSVQILKQTNQ
ncbi:MAG: DUF1573 domain-containing protein [Gemmatimonadaceae bacterium]|nr:DUF1573 domain-containing protein [Chitinophagaceae bacterium]